MNTQIQDRWGRVLRDLRISLIDRCNFRCTYCMPKEIFGADYPFLPQAELLTFEEIERLAGIFVRLGVKKIRLTGGEPLLRKNVHQLVEKLAVMEGLEDIALTTNGTMLASNAKALKDAGLTRVNVSLDALDHEIFAAMNQVGASPQQVIHGIHEALQAGLHVKVNMVVKKGLNEQEIVPMAAFFKELGVPLRFIEYMDVGTSNGWNMEHVISKQQIYERLSRSFQLEPLEPDYFGEVAKRYRYQGSDAEVGFITSITESFCSSCTRGRLSADGKFYTCLFASEGMDLRSLLRSRAEDDGIVAAIMSIWEHRTDRYSDERTADASPSKSKIEMSYIGG